MNGSTVNVVIAGGRKLFREGLRSLLEREATVSVIGEADDGRDAARLLKALRVDVVILNITSPAPHDLDTVHLILRARPESRLILLTVSPPIDYVQELMAAGAKGCLTKECAGPELLAAIEKVMTGGIYLSPDLVDRVVSRYVTPTRMRPAVRSLAPREREVLRKIAAGETAKEIAAAMSVSIKTIETHRRRIMHKLNRHTVAELTKYAVMEGLSPLETSV